MPKRLIALSLILAALLAAGCGESSDAVAEVGGAAVTTDDINQMVDALGTQGQQWIAGEDGRRMLIEERINEEILYQSALDQGIDELPDIKAQIDRAVRNIVIGYFYRISFADLGFTEEEIQAYYEEHKDELTTPAQAHVRSLTYPTEGEARRALDRLESGTGFDELIEEQSDDPNAGRQMLLSDNSQNAPGKLIEAVFSAEEGSIVGPVDSAAGFHLVMVDKLVPGEAMSLEQARQTIVENLLVPEEDLRAWFEENREQFARPESARLRFILTDDQAAAEELAARLRAGADFAETARRESIDPVTAPNGGLVPALYNGAPSIRGFQQSEDVEAFTEAVFALEAGEISDPLELSRGWAVILVEELQEAQTPDFEEVREQAKSQLMRERITERENAFFSELEESLGVERNQEMIDTWIENGSFLTVEPAAAGDAAQ
ncbi:MAG: hypothetical protein GF403_11230 [Candidatus Coatesbacteria bacterium]|nr:hypothetical protein [Candidatus Coatesbacteria bacterium]